MAGPFISKWFFQGNYGGWSEVWYPKGSSLAAALASCESCINDRIALMPAHVGLERLEVSDLTIRGDVVVSGSTPLNGTWTGTSSMQPPWDALLINLRNVDGLHRGRKFMRGLPANAVSDGKFSPVSPWPANFLAFQTTFIANMQLVKKTDPGPPPVYTPYAITTINYDRLVHRPAGRPFGLLVGRRTIR